MKLEKGKQICLDCVAEHGKDIETNFCEISIDENNYIRWHECNHINIVKNGEFVKTFNFIHL